MSQINPRPSLTSIRNELSAKGAVDEHKLDHEAQQVLGIKKAEHAKKEEQAKLGDTIRMKTSNKLALNLLGRMISGLDSKPITKSQAISSQEKVNDHKKPNNLTITFA